MKRKVGLLCVLILALSLFTAMPAANAAPVTSFNNVVLYDIAYSPTLGMYVAVGNATGSGNVGKIYMSSNGYRWNLVKDNIASIGENNNARKDCVIWYPDKSEFIVEIGGGTYYTSTDGLNWSLNSTAAFSSGGFRYDGRNLISAGGNKVYVHTDPNNLAIKTEYITTATTVYIDTIASDGAATNTAYLAGNMASAYFSNDGGSNWTKYYPIIPGYGSVSDIFYSSVINKFLISGKTQGSNLTILGKDGSAPVGSNMPGISAEPSGTKPVTIGSSGSKLLAGMSNGSLYYAIEDSNFTKDSMWTKVPASITDNTLPVKQMCFGGDKFVVVCSDGINSDVLVVNSDCSSYIRAFEIPNTPPSTNRQLDNIEIDTDKVSNIDIAGLFTDADSDFLTITATSSNTAVATASITGNILKVGGISAGNSDITVTASDGLAVANVTFNVSVRLAHGQNFAGVVLCDAAYSPDLGLYLLTGNRIKAVNDKSGIVYVSKDGINWRMVIPNPPTAASPEIGFNKINSVVWWDEAKKFVIHLKGGTAWLSSDGEQWSYYGSSTIGGGGGIKVINGKLYDYSANGKIRLFNTDLSVAATYDTGMINIDNIFGDGADSIVAVAGYQSKITVDGGATWTLSPNITNYGKVSDGVYSNSLQKYIITVETPWNSSGNKMVILSTDGTFIKSSVPGSDITQDNSNRALAIETNGSRFIIGTRNGKLFAADDSANFNGSTTWTEINHFIDPVLRNTLPVRSICFGNGKYLAICSNNETDPTLAQSDVLVLGSNDAGYVKVSTFGAHVDTTAPGELTYENGTVTDMAQVAGKRIKATVPVNNSLGMDVALKTALAVYDSNGVLKSVGLSTTDVAGTGINNIEANVLVPQEATQGWYVKVFVWNSLNSITPFRANYTFFK